MGEVVNLEAFRTTRKPMPMFKSVACPLCDIQVSGTARGDEVVYACYGDDEGHKKLEWSHAAKHVAV